MAYYRKKRHYKKRNNDSSGVLVIITLAALMYAYTKIKDFVTQHPYTVTVLALIVGIVLVLLIFGALFRRRNVYKTYDITSVDTMDGLDFERCLASLLGKLGYTNIRLTEKYDLGIDIVAKKNGVTWGIQAKRYNGQVRAEAVRQAHTALKRYRCDKAMVITNSTYTRPAQMLAADNNVVLIDRSLLTKWINKTNRNKPNRGVIL